ncbi:MAG: hypothetical protein HY287_13450 [Planctomycetes bacterium]|nr:hypothetical protein [Planctomycetota bacterium]MBI3835328.1 hypothetical protein [Planctomycetota bacterium]
MPSVMCECGARYKVADASLGKKSKCKKCGNVFTLKAEDDGIFSIAPDEFSSPSPLASAIASGEVTQAPQAPGRDGDDDTEQSEGFVGRSGFLANRPSAAATIPITPTRSYFADVLRTFLFPSSPENLVSFIVIVIFMSTLGPIFAFMPFPYGMILGFLLQGWYAALRFEIVRTSASGEDRLPSVGVSDPWEDLVKPALCWIASWIVVVLPASAYLIYVVASGRLGSSAIPNSLSSGISAILGANTEIAIFGVLLLLGACAWPMLILCVAIQGFSTLLRPDLILSTMIRTFPGYVATLLLVCGTIVLQNVLSLISSGRAATTGGSLVIAFLVSAMSIYVEIVLMRLIGLYYHHFKKKFAWDWE